MTWLSPKAPAATSARARHTRSPARATLAYSPATTLGDMSLRGSRGVPNTWLSPCRQRHAAPARATRARAALGRGGSTARARARQDRVGGVVEKFTGFAFQ